MRLNGRARPDGAGGLEIEAREVYANCPKYIHPRAATLPEPAPATDRRWSNGLTPTQAQWLSSVDTLFIATRHLTAGADVSHRGGDPGFVQVADPGHVLIPDYPGNTMFNTLGNIAADGRAGLLVVDFTTGRLLQLTGRSTISWDADLVAGFRGAERVVTLELEAVEESAPAGPRLIPEAISDTRIAQAAEGA